MKITHVFNVETDGRKPSYLIRKESGFFTKEDVVGGVPYRLGSVFLRFSAKDNFPNSYKCLADLGYKPLKLISGV